MKKKDKLTKELDKLFQDAVVGIAQDPNTKEMVPDIDLKTGTVVGFYIKHKHDDTNN